MEADAGFVELLMGVLIFGSGTLVGMAISAYRARNAAGYAPDRLSSENSGLLARAQELLRNVEKLELQKQEVDEALMLSRERLAAADADLKMMNRQLADMDCKRREDLADMKMYQDKLIEKCDSFREMISEKEKALVALQSENHFLQETAERQLRENETARSDMTKQFDQLANKIFEEKTKTFQQSAEKNLEGLITPVRERFAELQQKIEISFGQQRQDQTALREQIKHIAGMNRVMSETTENLVKALKGDVKTQGGWGEMILERILEESGLRRDHDYTVQASGLRLKDAESGKQQRPDVIVNLPDCKHVIIDSKVTLTDYERYCSAKEDIERAAALKGFHASVRAHIRGLAARSYQDNEALGSPDFVLMFIPIEGAYSLALQSDPGLHHFAWEQRIVLVGASTLFATLKTVASLWRIELQNKNAQEIADSAGKFYDKIIGFMQDMDRLGEGVQKVDRAYRDAFNKLCSGPGNMLRRAEKLRELGAKTTKETEAKKLIQSVPALEDA